MGLDMCIPFRLEWYNPWVDPSLRLENFGQDSHLGILLGNTGTLWAPFQHWLREDPARVQLPHPLNHYIEAQLRALQQQLEHPVSIRYAHDVKHAPFAAQKLAERIGLTWTSPSMLSIHPVYGPWISFRAALSFPIEAPECLPDAPTPAPACDACARACLPAFERVMQGLQTLAHADDPCMESGKTSMPTSTHISTAWKEWVAVREACPLGRAHVFVPSQLEYHYTHRRELLLKVDC